MLLAHIVFTGDATSADGKNNKDPYEFSTQLSLMDFVPYFSAKLFLYSLRIEIIWFLSIIDLQYNHDLLICT
jgi:hypothetical protein